MTVPPELLERAARVGLVRHATGAWWHFPGILPVPLWRAQPGWWTLATGSGNVGYGHEHQALLDFLDWYEAPQDAHVGAWVRWQALGPLLDQLLEKGDEALPAVRCWCQQQGLELHKAEPPPCGTCRGWGTEDGCEECGEQWQGYQDDEDWQDEDHWFAQCGECDGTGRVDGEICEECGGAG